MQGGGGAVSLLTQSGNVCAAVYAIARRLGVEFSHFINTGNEACVDFAQYLEYLAQDAGTEVCMGYIEELRDGPRFIAAAQAFAQQDKLLVLYKAGETDKGSEAVRSHTSALAGDQQIYSAAFVSSTSSRAATSCRWHSSPTSRSTASAAPAGAWPSSPSRARWAPSWPTSFAAGPGCAHAAAAAAGRAACRNPDYGMVSNPVDVTGNVVNDRALCAPRWRRWRKARR
jgi:acyl-CoA synthetase (NDP forming)